MPRVPGLRNPGLGTKLHPRLWEESPEPWSALMLLHWAHVLVSVVSDSLQPHGCSPPGSSAHGISQARRLEWVAISFSRGFSWPGIRPTSSALQADSLPLSLQGSPSFVSPFKKPALGFTGFVLFSIFWSLFYFFLSDFLLFPSLCWL